MSQKYIYPFLWLYLAALTSSLAFSATDSIPKPQCVPGGKDARHPVLPQDCRNVIDWLTDTMIKDAGVGPDWTFSTFKGMEPAVLAPLEGVNRTCRGVVDIAGVYNLAVASKSVVQELMEGVMTDCVDETERSFGGTGYTRMSDLWCLLYGLQLTYRLSDWLPRHTI